MSTRRLFRASLTLAGIVAGCGPTQPPAAPTTQPIAAVAPSVHRPNAAAGAATGADVAGASNPAAIEPKPTADVLAKQAAKYSQDVEARLSKRIAAGKTASSPTVAAGAHVNPSAVKFVDPNAERRSENAGSNSSPPGSEASRLASGSQQASLNPILPLVIPSTVVTPPRSDAPFNKDAPAVNTPLIVGQPRPLPATDDMALKFAHQVHDYPQDVAAQLDWQLLQFLQGQSVPQVQSLAGLPSEDRELLSTLLDGLTNFRNGLRADNNQLLSRKIRPIIELSDRLRTQAELTIPTLSLCTDVKGFGVYEPIDPARFEAGQEHRVIVYCEVENFASVLDEQKRWQTKLTQEVVLYTDQGGLEVWKDKTAARPIVDYSRNRRHDFFIVKMIRLPANLTIGQYLLKVSVVDQQANRVAENTTPVQIVAQ
ncbi:MAG TPA: hypothetical protein VG326_20670 [Tepidisphaeraceae bacterium]|nr:hypothetical protein [Tepidisphaeraceae bacterium]